MIDSILIFYFLVLILILVCGIMEHCAVVQVLQPDLQAKADVLPPTLLTY